MDNKQLIQLLIAFLVFITGAVLSNVKGCEKFSLIPLIVGGLITLYFFVIMIISWLKNRK